MNSDFGAWEYGDDIKKSCICCELPIFKQV